MASFRGISRNIPYLRQQFVALLGNTSVSVKFICVVVFCTYFLSFSERAVRVLSVTPGYLLPPAFWIWTAFTHCFLEIHFWEVCVDIITVGLCGKLIEPLWGSIEMMTFFAVVNVGVALVSAFFYLFLYMCTFNPDLLFRVHIHGLAGYIAGVSVAVKQIMPDHLLCKTPLTKITNRNVPMCVLTLSLVLYLVGLLDGTYPTMFTTGLGISWIYLRFYQRHTNGTRGDMAENFTFASFFPNVLQPPVAVVSNTVHSFLMRIGACRRPVRKYDLGAPSSITISLPGVEVQDAERRRQIALKALSERLSKSEDSSWPASEHGREASSHKSVVVTIPKEKESPLSSVVPQSSVTATTSLASTSNLSAT